MKKVLTAGALAALLSTGFVEAIQFKDIKSQAFKGKLERSGIKAMLDQFVTGGVPAWDYINREDLNALMTAVRNNRDPRVLLREIIIKKSKREEKERMSAGGPAAAAAAAFDMDKTPAGRKMMAENYPYKLGQFVRSVIGSNPVTGRKGKAIKARAENNDAFAMAMDLHDPYALGFIATGDNNRAKNLIMRSPKLIPYFNTQVLPADAVAKVGPGASSAQFQDAIKQVFYVMNMHKQNIRQNGSMISATTRESRDILFTVTGVNDQGYRVSFVNLSRGRFQHAFVPFLGGMQGQYQPLKIGQLLVAKIDFAAGRQQQNFDFPAGGNLQGEINGNQFDIDPNIQGVQEEYRLIRLPISKGLVPVRS